MNASITVGAFGVAVHVNATGLSGEEEGELRVAWERCRATPGSRTIELSAGIGGAISDAATLGHQLSTRVTLALIELVRDDLLLLHACAVAHPRTGAVVALIGPSGRGKTTAAITLGRRFRYVTDETVAVGAHRAVLPYPKPLSVVQPGLPIKAQVGPQELGLLDIPTGTELRLEFIALLDRRSDAPPEPELTPVGLVEAIDDVVPQISYLSARTRPLVHLADLLREIGGIRRLTYRESERLPEIVEKLLESSGPAVSDATEAWIAAPLGSTAPTGIRRSTVNDAIDDGHHVIVLKDDMVRVLGGVATQLWRAADGVTIQELTDTLIAEFGTPPEGDPETLVRAAVDELLSIGLLLGESDER